MTGYWPHSFFASVLVHKHAKKGLGQYPGILATHLVNNPYVQSSEIAVNQEDQNFKDREFRRDLSNIGTFKNCAFVSHDHFFAVFSLGYWGREGL